jgi:hypothetical protein
MKKIGTVITVLSLIIMLSSCQLAKDYEDMTPDPIDQDLIGIYLQMYDGSDINTPLLPLFGEEGAYHFYHEEAMQGGYSFIKTISGPFVLNLHTNTHIKDDTLNGITTRTQDIDYTCDVIIGRELMNNILYMHTIHMGQTMELYGSTGYMISDVTMTTTYEDDVILDDIPTHVTYKITIKMVDLLTSVKLIEMDQDNEIISSIIITEPQESYEVSSDAAYLIVEDTYEKEDGSTYQVRQIITKNEFVQLNFLNEDGFVTIDGAIQIIFPK